jgi:hypothetical protein
MTRSWVGRALFVLGIVAGLAGGAQATGTGGPPGWRGWSGDSIDDVFESLDGTLEFSEFRFYGVDPDDIDIEIGERGITFSGNESVTGLDFDRFQIRYTVRALTDLGIAGTTLRMDSDTEGGRGAVIASKKIRAPRDEVPKLPWMSGDSWKKEGSWKHGDWDDDESWKGGPPEGGWGRKGDGFEHIGTLLAYNIAGGWVCGCGHHHESAKDIEEGCGIEQASDHIEYDSERVLHIEDTVRLLSFGKGEKDSKTGVSWLSLTNDYVVTPEPGTAGMIGLGLAGLILSQRRSRGAAAPKRSPNA